MFLTFFIWILRKPFQNHSIAESYSFLLVLEPVSGDQYEKSYEPFLLNNNLVPNNVFNRTNPGLVSVIFKLSVFFLNKVLNPSVFFF